MHSGKRYLSPVVLTFIELLIEFSTCLVSLRGQVAATVLISLMCCRQRDGGGCVGVLLKVKGPPEVFVQHLVIRSLS